MSQKSDKFRASEKNLPKTKNKKKGLLSKSFRCAAYGAFLAGSFFFAQEIVETTINTIEPLRLKMIENDLQADINDVCLRASTLRPPRLDNGAPFVPTKDQALLKDLFNKMGASDIGRRLNKSAADNDVIWCVNNIENSNYGYYMSLYNMASLSQLNLGNVDDIKNSQNKFNKTLRTAYEENAHAWQHNEHNALNHSIFIHPMHAMTVTLASEADARVITFAALYQHLQNGDNGPWDDNFADSKNRPIMATFKNTLNSQSPLEDNLPALRAMFDKFYNFPSLSSAYQNDIHPSSQWGSRKLDNDYFNRKFGRIPGLSRNYMSISDINPEASPYNQIHNKELLYRMAVKLINMGEDPLTLKHSPSDIVKDYISFKIEASGRFHYISALNKEGAWKTIVSSFVFNLNEQSPFHINERALKHGYLIISKKSEANDHSLVHIQKLSPQGQIQDLRPAETIPDYSPNKERYVHYRNLDQLKVMPSKALPGLHTINP